ncbi:hypothetical protein SLNSH_08800 [Alsobacter soli]|uniref:Uncharacterized protein n=2 Tax=Alsobacter soli TaxID=2109933 RepID=A0A2T1HUI3_9HYPH|nr:hypothetical protein SLNSH_08800 [Alsobacter soli]
MDLFTKAHAVLIRPEIESLLRRLFVRLPLRSDGQDHAPADAMAAAMPAARRRAPAHGGEVSPILAQVREWAQAAAWTNQPSMVVLEQVMAATEGRLDEAFGADAGDESRQSLRDLCRQEAWRMLMDIRRAA